ncbi:MAG: cyclopropane fatty acyl phospholipid synthase [Nitrospiraceae bacterium]|nr:cyclopropane fatty acyl phospholipid synthase [Nitrospiraceae bacterium]
MRTDKSKQIVQNILTPAGITINGSQPWDIRVKNENFYQRVLHDGSLGLGESYMYGWWECEKLDEFFGRIIPSRPEDKIKRKWRLLFHLFSSAIINRSSRSRAFEIGERHYDIGNDLFKYMLDRRMVYSCAYWKDADNLDDAQEAKLDLICRKLALHPGDRILDIGCGWGSFAKYAAGKYGVEVVGITVSKEQMELGKEMCKGFPVEIRMQDYRDLSGVFDHIVSVGMFEHVGFKNYEMFMKTTRRCLKEGGLFLLHTIGNRHTMGSNDPWFEKYIFPNSIIPSMKQISASVEELFVAEDWHNFGADYDRTLIAWFRNFDASWHKLKEKNDERFYRMWKYYLLSCAGIFRSRRLQVWQIVFSKNGVPGGYCSVR